jgi:hypothetical protein
MRTRMDNNIIWITTELWNRFHDYGNREDIQLIMNRIIKKFMNIEDVIITDILPSFTKGHVEETFYSIISENNSWLNEPDEKEIFFIKTSKINDINIKFDFIEYKYLLFYFDKYLLLFEHDKKSHDFWINSKHIWYVFGQKFKLDYNDTQKFMNSMVEKYFDLYKYNILRNENYHTEIAENNFNN